MALPAVIPSANLRTASPFENPGLHSGVHAEGNYNDMSDLKGQKYSVFLTDTVADNTIGFLLGGVHSDTHTRTDSLNAYNQNIYGPPTYPYAGGAGAVPLVATPDPNSSPLCSGACSSHC